jgi:hypothetical protein
MIKSKSVWGRDYLYTKGDYKTRGFWAWYGEDRLRFRSLTDAIRFNHLILGGLSESRQ